MQPFRLAFEFSSNNQIKMKVTSINMQILLLFVGWFSTTKDDGSKSTEKKTHTHFQTEHKYFMIILLLKRKKNSQIALNKMILKTFRYASIYERQKRTSPLMFWYLLWRLVKLNAFHSIWITFKVHTMCMRKRCARWRIKKKKISLSLCIRFRPWIDCSVSFIRRWIKSLFKSQPKVFS